MFKILNQVSCHLSPKHKTPCGYFLLCYSGCHFSSGILCGMGRMMADRTRVLDLEDEIVRSFFMLSCTITPDVVLRNSVKHGEHRGKKEKRRNLVSIVVWSY